MQFRAAGCGIARRHIVPISIWFIKIRSSAPSYVASNIFKMRFQCRSTKEHHEAASQTRSFFDLVTLSRCVSVSCFVTWTASRPSLDDGMHLEWTRASDLVSRAYTWASISLCIRYHEKNTHAPNTATVPNARNPNRKYAPKADLSRRIGVIMATNQLVSLQLVSNDTTKIVYCRLINLRNQVPKPRNLLQLLCLQVGSLMRIFCQQLPRLNKTSGQR